jgi:hypothetical protein
MVFASGLGNRGTETTRLIAELPDGRRFTLPVEYAGPTDNFSGIQQIIFKLDAAMAGSSRVLLSIEGGDGAQAVYPFSNKSDERNILWRNIVAFDVSQF